MAKVELKTKKTKKSVTEFIDKIPSPQRKKDAKIVLKLMKEITGKKPVMWGTSIIGFDDYHYKYKTGREGDFFKVGFSARKDTLTIYILPGYQNFGPIMKKLGKHKLGKGCLYIKKIDDINLSILKKVITMGYKEAKRLEAKPQ